MKTPREILLARHKAVKPKLDDLRQNVVAQLNNKDDASCTAQKTQSFSDSLVSSLLGCPAAIWREMILPARRIWAGLALVWLLILAANFSIRDHSGINSDIKMANSTPSPDEIMSFRQQQQLLTELVGPDDPSVAKAQKTYSPRPSGERRLELLTT